MKFVLFNLVPRGFGHPTRTRSVSVDYDGLQRSRNQH